MTALVFAIPPLLLVLNVIYCIIKIREDLARRNARHVSLGIWSCIGAVIVLLWLGMMWAMQHGGL